MQPTASDHDMRPGTSEQQHRGNPGQTYNNSNGQEQMMSNGYNAQDPQQMTNSGNGAQPAAVDRRDTLTRCNDNPPDYFIDISTPVPYPRYFRT